MKLCDTCIYGSKTEYFKPCIIYRDNCEYYEREEDMKAIIQIDVPDYQIGQEVSIYFRDTMMIKGIVQEPKTGHCKDCKHFEYDSVAKVDGIPLIIAHEICNRWGDGCKTRENGYCFLFESQEDISSGNITKTLQDVAKIVN